MDLVSILGMPAAYVGFTAASGGAAVEKDILNWKFTNTLTQINFPADVITGTAGVDNITISQDSTDHTRLDWTMGAVNPAIINQLSITDTNGLTINGLGGADVVTLDYTNGNPMPTKLILNETQGSPNSFTINGFRNSVGLANSTIDIKRSTVFFNYGAGATPLSLLQGYIASGFNGGTWVSTATTGVVTSSNAAANPNHNTGIGYADSADGSGINPNVNTVELQYTLNGDANLDTSVNINDLNILLGHIGTAGDTWDQGDFNYDTSVNINDLNQVLGSIGTTLGGQAAPAAAAASTNSSNLGLQSGSASGTNNSSSGSNKSDSGNSSSSNKGSSVAHSATTTGSGHKKNRRHHRKH